MKKSFLVLAAALSLGLAACGNKPAPGPVTPELPTEAGKITFWFEMADDEAAIEVPEYCGIFLTGAFFGQTDWPTKAEDVVTLNRLAEDSNIYYGQWEGDYTAIEDKGFQLTLGYSAASGAPSTGVNWSYKSVECQAGSGESGMDNLQFTLSDDGLTAALGTHHWEEAPGPVVRVQNITVSLTLKDAAPEWVTLYAPGNFRNNWACKAAQDAMTPSTDRKTWTIHIDEQLLGTYEMKVIAEYTADGDSWGWGNVILDNGEGGNFSLNILRANANGTIDLNERANEGNAFEFDFANKLPDPTKISTANFKVTLGAALDTTVNAKWYVIGSFTGWKPVELTLNEAKTELTLQLTKMIWDTEASFGICVDSDWHIAVKAFDESKEEDKQFSNFSYEVPHVEHNVNITVSAEEVVKMNTAVDTAVWVNVKGALEVVPANVA